MLRFAHRGITWGMRRTVGLSLACLVACSSETNGPTYHADVAPLVQRECLSCHVEGGIGPFVLDSYASVADNANVVVSAVQSGYMPPWQPDRSCGDFTNERGLSAEERDVFQAWNAAGRPEGDPATAPPPLDVPQVVLDATHTARVPSYMPDVNRPDDYRCFILDMDIDETMFLTGSEVIPDAADLVHHALVYALTPDEVAIAQGDDDRDPGPGYTCFGGPIPSAGLESGLTNQIGAWVPGLQPDVFPDGEGIRVEAGGKIVIQVHYNTLAGTLRADETEFRARFTTEAPVRVVSTVPLPILDLRIEPGDEESRHRRTFRNYSSRPLRVRSLTAHMHLLGTNFTARKMSAGSDATEDAQCLLDIPDWDFNWQQSYVVPDAIEIAPLEGIEVSCVYDNSATHQPVVNGVQVEPRRVTWGEGTLDEMCILYIRREEPYVEPGETTQCAAAAACRAGCDDSISCILGCEELDRGCLNCAAEGLVDCSLSTCASRLLAIQDCFTDCVVNINVLGGSVDTCMRTECADDYAALEGCVDPLVAAGSCDAALSACGPGLVD